MVAKAASFKYNLEYWGWGLLIKLSNQVPAYSLSHGDVGNGKGGNILSYFPQSPWSSGYYSSGLALLFFFPQVHVGVKSLFLLQFLTLKSNFVQEEQCMLYVGPATQCCSMFLPPKRSAPGPLAAWNRNFVVHFWPLEDWGREVNREGGKGKGHVFAFPFSQSPSGLLVFF